MPGSWITRPVFVTSTFRDMQAERGWLVQHVFPELKDRLRQRHCHLEAIDLRWGVETVGEGVTEARELLVLKVCLAEIERSRPFLVALLGDRYGWVPPEGRMKRAVEEAGFETKVEGKSVTALEIEYGVLDSPDQRRRSRFYFRGPLPYDEMDEKTAADFSEGEGEAAERLAALKARIEREMGGRVRHYSAQWDAGNERVTGLEEFGRMVLEDLWADLEEEIAPLEERAEATWEDEERAAFEEFVEECERDFRGRAAITDELVEFATAPAEEGAAWGLSLTGGPGSGKSALMAHVYRKLEDRALVLANAAGISLRSTSVDMLLRRWIGELATFLDQPDHLGENPSPEELEQAFSRLLYQSAERTRVVVLLDALNQFEPTTRAAHMTWLPKMWHQNARLIATAIPGTQSDALQSRPGVEARDLPPLSKPEAEEIAAAICAEYHRTLNPDVLAVLTAKQTDGEAACGNPLWLELALEELNLLDEDDFRRVKQFKGRPDQQLHQLLLSVADEMPADIEGMYGWLLQKTEEVWGEAWARGFANLIAVSRAGWREVDLERLLPVVSGEKWDPGRFAGLRRSFRAHLVQRGLQGQWDFFHTQARQAVLRRNLPDDAPEVRRLHSLIADHLLSLAADDPLRETETMFHLMRADDKPRAAHYYASDLTVGALAGATQVLADEVLVGEAQEPNPGLEWVVSLFDETGLGESEVGSLAHRLLFEFCNAIEPRARLTTRLRSAEAAREPLSRLADPDPTNALWQHDLAASHQEVGGLLVARGDLKEAEEAYRAALAIGERLARSDRGNAGLQHDLSVIRSNVGDVLVARGNLQGAEKAYRAALTIAEYLAASDPTNIDWRRRAAMSHSMVGDVLRARGDLKGAEKAYRAALTIAERLAASDPTNTLWQADLSVSHGRIGDILKAQGDLVGAMDEYRACLSTSERLAVSDPTNADWQRYLSVSHGMVGEVLMAQGDVAGAMEEYRVRLATAERLVVTDSTNTLWQRDLSVSHERIGDVLLARGDPAGAMEEYRASRAIAESLAAAEPTNAGWQRDLSVSHERVGSVFTAQGDLAGAMEEYREALTITERLAAFDPTNTEWQRDLSVNYKGIAGALERLGDASAPEWWRKASEQLAGMKRRGLYMSAEDEAALDWLRHKAGAGTRSRQGVDVAKTVLCVVLCTLALAAACVLPRLWRPLLAVAIPLALAAVLGLVVYALTSVGLFQVGICSTCGRRSAAWRGVLMPCICGAQDDAEGNDEDERSGPPGAGAPK